MWKRGGREEGASTALSINVLSPPLNFPQYCIMASIRASEDIKIVLVKLVILWGTRLIVEGKFLTPFEWGRQLSYVHSTLALLQALPALCFSCPACWPVPTLFLLCLCSYASAPPPFHHLLCWNLNHVARLSSHVTSRNKGLMTELRGGAGEEKGESPWILLWGSALSSRGTITNPFPLIHHGSTSIHSRRTLPHQRK